MKDKPLKELLDEIGRCIEAVDSAERARVNAEFKKKKAHYDYLKALEQLEAKEYTL